MYEKFFGIDEQPFRLTPDPRYLYLSAKHREALGHLVYGIHEGAGFVAITGEIGAGKTTLLRSLLSRADDATQYAYILNPVLTGLELMQEINHELGIPSAGTRREMLTALNHFLLDQKRRGRRVVIVIDEAQALDGATLEQLRMLSNFETETAKLLQIVLVGQPELRDVLARPELEQLNQRVTVRWHLGPLDRAETGRYVAHRVTTAAGGRPRTLFTRGAIGQVYAYSRGVPRLINIICHRSLLVAFAHDRTRVTRGTVRRAIRELQEPRRVRPDRWRRAWVTASSAVAVLAVIATAGAIAWQRYGDAWRAGSARPAAAPDGDGVAGGGAVMRPVDAPAAGTGRGTPAEGVVEVAAAAATDPEALPIEESPGASPSGDGVAAAAARAREEEQALERSTLAEAIRQISPGNSAYAATESLLRAWNAPALAPAEASSPTIDLTRIARARGLEYLPIQGNLNLLRVLDLPAILELAPDDGSAPRFVTVERLHDELATVSVGRTPIEISTEVLGEAWFGKAHLFWQDVDRLGPMLSMGSSSPAVGRLHELLKSADVYAGAPSSTFANATQEAVLRFQRSKRLDADGKVGPMTMIALYQSVSRGRLPHLGAEPQRGGGSGDEDRFSALPGGRN